VVGHCQEAKGEEQNTGQEALSGCFSNPTDCLKTCQENSRATGCEYDTQNKDCFIHTEHLTGLNDAGSNGKNICWLFVVDKLQGSCTDELTTIIGNFTSNECFEQCQERREAQGCQYDISNQECAYFTCPMTSADNNNNFICWTFNKDSFNGPQGTGCGHKDSGKDHERKLSGGQVGSPTGLPKVRK